MKAEMIRIYLPLAIALVLVMYTLSRRSARKAKRAKEAAAQRMDARHRLRVIASRQDGETASFDVYNERLERQRELIERYNREHGDG